jgi:hypothetical protein
MPLEQTTGHIFGPLYVDLIEQGFRPSGTKIKLYCVIFGGRSLLITSGTIYRHSLFFDDVYHWLNSLEGVGIDDNGNEVLHFRVAWIFTTRYDNTLDLDRELSSLQGVLQSSSGSKQELRSL